jgi:hypothetical protein
MPFYFAVYGYEITKRCEFANFELLPVEENYKKARELALDKDQFNLTAIGEIKGDPNPHELFDLAGALTFCAQQWVVVSNAHNFPEKTNFKDVLEKFPQVYETTHKRPAQGPLIMEDTFYPEARRNYLDLCISRLRDEEFENKTNFRKAFFRNVEIYRMPYRFIDVTYYLLFSSLEILARTFTNNYTSSVAVVATDFLRRLGFAVSQDDNNSRHLGVQTYVHLRNALFHNGNFEKSVPENGNIITLKLKDYIGYLCRLMPDVLLRVIEYDDAHINWNRWIDFQPFKG